ncbi:hypothetical protein [Streptomyces xiaopingdaonensis]|uniref:Rv1733c family protein n=1 Tax=Streptomyces xiaopingdaonensis TaxID=1565415 RepID=UPI0003718FB8|nr:hypothetical protein [Streptomyces xiaopingdaonensis]
MVRTIAGLWRWRGNPLCRPTDLREAWLGVCAALLIVLGAPVAGFAGAEAVESALVESARQQHAERQRTWATAEQVSLERTVVTDAEAVAPPEDRYRVRAHWYAPDGNVRQGSMVTRRAVDVGDRFPIWTDQRGRHTGRPMTTHTASSHSALAGLGVGAAAVAAVECGRRCGVRLLMRRRYAAWAQEWQRIGPDWGRAGAGN